MRRAPLAVKILPPSHSEAFWELERLSRSPDDPNFQKEIDDLTDPLEDETFFRSTLYTWIIVLFSMLVVSLPLLFLIWRFRSVLSILNRAFSGMAASSGMP
jgi:hypothetical protein